LAHAAHSALVPIPAGGSHVDPNPEDRDPHDHRAVALVSDFAMRSGYDMGIAATADQIEFTFPPFELGDGEFAAVACALTTVLDAHEAYRWLQPLTDDEWEELVWHDTPAGKSHRTPPDAYQLERASEGPS
jgi:hypothetical protein